MRIETTGVLLSIHDEREMKGSAEVGSKRSEEENVMRNGVM